MSRKKKLSWQYFFFSFDILSINLVCFFSRMTVTSIGLCFDIRNKKRNTYITDDVLLIFLGGRSIPFLFFVFWLAIVTTDGSDFLCDFPHRLLLKKNLFLFLFSLFFCIFSSSVYINRSRIDLISITFLWLKKKDTNHV